MTIGSKWFLPKALAKEPCKLFIGNPYPCTEYIAIRVDVSPFARPSGRHSPRWAVWRQVHEGTDGHVQDRPNDQPQSHGLEGCSVGTAWTS